MYMEFNNKDTEKQCLERAEDDRRVLEDNTTEEESQIRAQTLWEQILTKVQEEESLFEGACNRWLRPARALSLTDQALTIGTHAFNKAWIEPRYSNILAEAVRSIIGKELPIIFKTDG